MVDNEGRYESLSPRETWNRRYAERERVWSGKPNDALVQILSSERADIEAAGSAGPITVLDLGCGEGADAVWLAQQGWKVSGIDISDLAIERARAAAAVAGVDIDFVCADLTTWRSKERFHLIVSSFLQSHTGGLDRTAILRNAVEFLAPGGKLIAISHASLPSFATADDPRHEHAFSLPDPVEEARDITAGSNRYEVVVAERRPREVVSPQGETGTIDDGVLVISRTR